jgi:hypothetical protein
MDKEHMPKDRKLFPSRTPEHQEQAEQTSADPAARPSGLTGLHRSVGNQAVQRILAQRSGGEGTELDEETAGRISQARGGGQALDSAVQTQMGESMGYDFGGVRVHTSPEADSLNRQLSAKAFTTGQDVFFREGAYDPNSSGGQELIAHELTHVVQQGTGAVRSGGRMTVNAPGDAYEQQADASARQVTGANASVQREGAEPEEDVFQAQTEQAAEEEEEDLLAQPKFIQREGAEPEEDVFQAQTEQAAEEEEEDLLAQPKTIQREGAEPEEDVFQAQTEQAAEEEEEDLLAQPKFIQRQEVPEEQEI